MDITHTGSSMKGRSALLVLGQKNTQFTEHPSSRPPRLNGLLRETYQCIDILLFVQ